MKTKITEFDELNDFAALLLANGYSLIVSELSDNKLPSWFHFSKDNKIGYVQYEKYRGARFSTVHKPCRECGTGFSLQEYLEYTELTLENAESAFMFAPVWAKQAEVNKVVKYSGPEEYVKQLF